MRNVIKKLRNLFFPSRGSMIVNRIYGDFLMRVHELEAAEKLLDDEVNDKIVQAVEIVNEAKVLKATMLKGMKLCGGLKSLIGAMGDEQKESTAD